MTVRKTCVISNHILLSRSHVFFTFTPHLIICSLVALLFQILYNWQNSAIYGPVRDEFQKVLSDAIEVRVLM